MTAKSKQSASPRAVRVGKLMTIGQIKSELGRVYREVRRGTTSSADGARMANMLAIMMQATVNHEWEQKLNKLEEPESGAIHTPGLPAPPLLLVAEERQKEPAQ